MDTVFPETIYSFESSRDYLHGVIEEKKKRNPRFSLRSFSKLTGVSVSALSGFLSVKKHLSMESAMRIAIFLRLNAAETDYFVTLVQLESTSSQTVKESLQEKLKTLSSNKLSIVKQEIVALRECSEVLRSYQYRIQDTLSSRTLIQLKDKKNGQRLNSFCDHFVSPERLVGSNSYFLPNEDGTFRVYLVEFANGEILPTLQWDNNLKLEIEFDRLGFPRINNLYMKTLGTSYFSIVDLVFSNDSVIQKGHRYNSELPDFKSEFYRSWIRTF